MRRSFEKRLETKIVRCEYLVGVWTGKNVQSLIDSLSGVPKEAKIVDIEEDDNDIYLVFQCEKEIKNESKT